MVAQQWYLQFTCVKVKGDFFLCRTDASIASLVDYVSGPTKVQCFSLYFAHLYSLNVMCLQFSHFTMTSLIWMREHAWLLVS